MIYPCPNCGGNTFIDTSQKPHKMDVAGETRYYFLCSRRHCYWSFDALIKTIKESEKMDATAFVTGNYIRADEVQNLPKELTIRDVKAENFDGKDKLVVDFAEIDQSLVLNTKSAKTLIEKLGAETDGWIGAKISLKTVEVEYSGRTVQSIRIEDVKK